MSRLILHRVLGSPPARAVMMLSDILGLQLQYKDVKLLQMEHKSPEFMKLNPMRTVPVLQDGDFVLSESHAIMKYLVTAYGGDKAESLYPSDVRTRALVDQAMFFNAGVFFKALGHVGRATFDGEITEPTRKHIQEIESSFAVVDAYVRDRPYIATDRLTIADLAAGATAISIQVFHKLDADNHAIMIYLLSKYGGTKGESLYPLDVRTRATVNQAMFFDTGILFVRIKVVALPTIMEGMKAPTEKHLRDLEEAYGMVEAYLSRHHYIAAEHVTIADLSVATTLAAAEAILPLNNDKFPLTAKWQAVMQELPYFKSIATPGIAKFNVAMQYHWKKNNKQ